MSVTDSLEARTHRILSAVVYPDAPSSGRGLFLLAGLPGVGKSTFASGLSALTGAVVLESDRLRQVLFGRPAFSMRESRLLFRGIAGAARQLLSRGYPVIVDATNLTERDRLPFFRLAESFSLAPIVIFLDAPAEVVEERLGRRLASGDGYSYADVAVYHRMRGRVEAVRREHLHIDTSDSAALEAGMAAALQAYRAGAPDEEGSSPREQ